MGGRAMTFRVATLPGHCPECTRNIRRGEIIVLVDTKWLHAVCAKVLTPSFAEYVGELSEALVEIAFSIPSRSDPVDLIYRAEKVIFGPDQAEKMRASALRIRAMSPAERLDELATMHPVWAATRDDPVLARAFIEACA